MSLGGDRRLGDLDMAGPEGLRQEQEWNKTPVPPCERRFDALFVERARLWPNAMAVEASDGTLTYSELDMLSSTLAARLQALGVVQCDVIPLFMTKVIILIFLIDSTLSLCARWPLR